MKKWWVRSINVVGLDKTPQEIAGFANTHNLKPGEIVSLGHHVGFQGVPYQWTIMYFAEKEIKP